MPHSIRKCFFAMPGADPQIQYHRMEAFDDGQDLSNYAPPRTDGGVAQDLDRP
ncbi:MAG: hypothetical protein AAFR36_32170 [Bacteroidota bacterium]